MRTYRPTTTSPADRMAAAEQVGRLRADGHGPLLDAIGDPRSYGANGRLVYERLAKRLRVSRQTATRRVADLRRKLIP